MEYAGAVYHVMSRGNAGQTIFANDEDRRLFLETLGDACERCGWRIHAYVLMDNHYHVLLETPEPNLVAGMKWMQGTYTQRFNRRHGRCGHLFQGRYKALPVMAADGYFEAVSSYIHLNPARARRDELPNGDLAEYRWSSYPGYLHPERRRSWLCVDRVLAARQWADSPAGRRAYRQYLQNRVRELAASGEENPVAEDADRIRRGWCLGPAEFKDRLEALIDGRMEKKRRSSYSGGEAARHDERQAERLLQAGLRALGADRQKVCAAPKGADEKCLLAWLVRRHTAVSNEWICGQLNMGRPDCLSRYPRKIDETRDRQLLELRRRLEEITKIRD